MENILYEASFKIHFAFSIPVVMMIACVLLPVALKMQASTKEAEVRYKIVKFVCIIWFFLAAIFAAFIGYFQLDMYNKIVGEYKKGNYKIVEGYVENFEMIPDGEQEYEHFTIDNVPFSYSDFTVQQGYNKTKDHGGVITGNGQHLKIGYVYYDTTYGNVIVYIEELP